MRRIWVALCLFFVSASCGNARPPLTVILLPGTSLKDWRSADAPNLHQLMQTGAIALMNTRTARLPNDHARETPESALLTLGAGARAAERTNTVRLGYQIRLGNLTDTLVAHHIAVLAGGGPYADAVAAKSDGKASHLSPLTAAHDQFIIWDAGPNIAAADSMIGSAAAQTTRLQGQLIVLSPFASDAAYGRGERLTPVLEWGQNIPQGLLRSASTHRLGLVTNTDFAPTTAAYFGLRREDFAVRPFGDLWKPVSASDPEGALLLLQSQAEQQAQGMKILPYLAIALAVWIVAGTVLWFSQRLPLLWPLTPAATLGAALFSNSLLSLFGLSLALFLLAWIVSKRLGTQSVFLVLLAVIAVSLIVDMLTGSRLMQRNLLGYSAIEGARYYGIGNEAMGVLIGALVVLAGRVWPRMQSGHWSILTALAMISLLLGSANAGAKAGGVLVSLAAFGTLGFTLCGGRWTVRVVLALIVGIGAVTGMVAFGDSVLGHGAHSHLGEAVRRIQSGGIGEAGDIVKRKLAVETRLAYHSAWAVLLWSGLICLVMLWRRNLSGTVSDQAIRLGGLAAMTACVALNDAGVVAGALCLIPLWCDSVINYEKKQPLQKPLVSARAV